VLCLHSATLPPLGADTWVHQQILRNLDRATHALYVACATGRPGAPTPTYEALAALPGVHVMPVDLGPELSARQGMAKLGGIVRSLAAIPSLARLGWLIRRRRIDLVYTSDRPRDALAAVVLGRLTRAKSLVHVHVAYGNWMGRFLRWSLSHADGLIAISDFVGKSLREAGIPAQRVHVVHNAIDPFDWKPGEGRSAARCELGIPDTAPVVITVCRLFPEKGPAELIRALGIVRRDVPDARLLVVGSDVTGGRFSTELADLVRDLELADAVQFLGRRDDVPRLMAAADVYAMPSFEEPFGLVFLEAMAMHLPVVALANGGTLEVVRHGETGLLSQPGDLGSLAGNLRRLLLDPEMCAAIGRRGRTEVERRFTTHRQACEVARVFAAVLAHQAKPPIRREST
jgi:glycosyltransferase involved in cell wall biosynthesis